MGQYKQCPSKRIRLVFLFAIAFLIATAASPACTLVFLLWSIGSKSADPLFRFVRNGKIGYIDSTGKVIIRPTLARTSDGEFHEGLLAHRDDRGYRYIDRSGAVVFRTDAHAASDFSEGLAATSIEFNGRYLYGFLDRTGRLAIPRRYFSVSPFSEELARVSVSGELNSTGYIDHSGTFVIPPRLTFGSDFHEGLAAAILDGPCQITNGGSCQRPEFAPTQSFASYDCRFAFVDRNGKPVSNLRFDDAGDFSEGLAPVRVGKKWGFVNKGGEFAISPRFEYAQPFSEGLAPIFQNGKAGFIDHSARIVIPPQFDSVEPFSDGRALVVESTAQNPTYRYIDTAGRSAFPGTFTYASSFTFGLADVELPDGTYAWIDTAGKRVLVYRER